MNSKAHLGRVQKDFPRFGVLLLLWILLVSRPPQVLSGCPSRRGFLRCSLTRFYSGQNLEHEPSTLAGCPAAPCDEGCCLPNDSTPRQLTFQRRFSADSTPVQRRGNEPILSCVLNPQESLHQTMDAMWLLPRSLNFN